eukprot:360539-Chlamydomonas_euryale.AAC.1
MTRENRGRGHSRSTLAAQSGTRRKIGGRGGRGGAAELRCRGSCQQPPCHWLGSMERCPAVQLRKKAKQLQRVHV